MTPKQILAVQLLATGLSQAEVAEQVGINPRTLTRWLNQEEFVKALEEIKQQTIKKTIDKTSDEFSEITLEHLKAAKNYRKMSDIVVKSAASQLIKNPGAIDELLTKANLYNAWNLILDRSIKIERTALGLDYHDVGVAIAFLQRLGYEVTDPTLQPATPDGETPKSVTKGLTEEQLNEIKAGILGVSLEG